MFLWNSLASSMIQRMLAIYVNVLLFFFFCKWMSNCSCIICWRLFSIDLLLRPCQKSVSCMYFYRFSTVSLMYVSTLSQYHTESILETTLSFELRHWFLPLHSSSKLFLDTLGPLPFHIHFRIMCVSTKCFAERVQYELH